jgi:DNA-binding MarR family transcriptional regulator
MEQAIGVTGPQRFVILLLGRFPGIGPGEVARVLRLHPSTVTGVVSRLEQAGLLRSTPDQRDGRKRCLVLTDAGKALDRKRGETIENAVREAISAVPDETIETVRSLLLSITQSLGKGHPSSRSETR